VRRRVAATAHNKAGILDQSPGTEGRARPGSQQSETRENKHMKNKKELFQIFFQPFAEKLHGNPVYLYVTQSTAQNAEVGGFLLINIRNVLLQSLKTLFEMCSPEESEIKSHFLGFFGHC